MPWEEREPRRRWGIIDGMECDSAMAVPDKVSNPCKKRRTVVVPTLRTPREMSTEQWTQDSLKVCNVVDLYGRQTRRVQRD